jgi:hypothetical protein
MFCDGERHGGRGGMFSRDVEGLWWFLTREGCWVVVGGWGSIYEMGEAIGGFVRRVVGSVWESGSRCRT